MKARVLIPIVQEVHAEAGLPARDPTEEEIELAWVMHGGIIYYGVRTLIYEASSLDNKGLVLRESIDAFLPALLQAR